MARTGEIEPSADVSAKLKQDIFDGLCDRGLEGEKLVSEYERCLRLLSPHPLADIALAAMQAQKEERNAGLIPLDTDPENHTITTTLLDRTETA